MIHLDLYSEVWTPWRKPYYLMDGRKFPIYTSSNCCRYWLLNNKLYFGTYQSLYHWEIKLYVAEGQFNDADVKNIRKLADSLLNNALNRRYQLGPPPPCQLLHGGNAIPKWKWYLPERNEIIELTTTIEKNWKSQTVHYFWKNEHVGKITDLMWSGLLTGKFAQISVEPQYEMLLPHFLGSSILTGIN